MSEAHDLSGFMVDPSVEALVYVDVRDENRAYLDGFDGLYIAIVNRLPEEVRLFNIEKNGCKILEKWFDKDYLYKMIKDGYRKDVLHLIKKGEVLYDRSQIINKIQELAQFIERKNSLLDICVEFSHFLKHFLDAKESFKSNKLIDSFHYCNQAILHWANLAILEKGLTPNEQVWDQVQGIDYTVYKLYEELSSSPEPMNKRIELFLLASEFAIMSKLKGSSRFLIDIIGSRNESWSLNELYHHPSLKNSGIELVLLLDKLEKRSLISEVKVNTQLGLEKRYTRAEK